jgi:hypothetical protein
MGDAVVGERGEVSARELGAQVAVRELAFAGAGPNLARASAAGRVFAPTSRARFELGLFGFVVTRRHGADVRAIVLVEGALEAPVVGINAYP